MYRQPSDVCLSLVVVLFVGACFNIFCSVVTSKEKRTLMFLKEPAWQDYYWRINQDAFMIHGTFFQKRREQNDTTQVKPVYSPINTPRDQEKISAIHLMNCKNFFSTNAQNMKRVQSPQLFWDLDKRFCTNSSLSLAS